MPTDANGYRAPRPQIAEIEPYDPKYLPARVMISANENPRPLPHEVQAKIEAAIAQIDLNRYPDPLANPLRELIGKAWGYDREYVLMGNGGDELLFDFALCWGGPERTMLTCPPTFSVYEANAVLTDTQVVSIPRKSDFSLDEEAILARIAQGDIDYAILTSPNNPTGNTASPAFIEKLLKTSDTLIMVDEAYGEFGGESMIPYLDRYPNLVVLKTFSKAYALAGVRLGYVLANPQVIREFIKVRQPYSVDAVSQAIGMTVYENRALLEPGIEAIKHERTVLLEELAALPGAEVYPSQANFILVRIPHAHRIWEQLLERGILVRDFSSAPSLENCLRITIGTEEENRALIEALHELTANPDNT